ncbi:MAG: anhydro-N-acetylmuramic acid kinase [Silicimonas sp.]|nr:anhydro-N-acetylmuramic acid kinase [Silicimonas sp.]
MSKTSAIWALGAMSGTSLDGVDAAMVRTDGIEVFEFGESAYRAYSEEERAVLRAAFGHETGPKVAAAAEVIEIAHAELLAGFDGAGVIGFHGQTTVHLPDQGRTCQIGNGEVLARALERPVVWDFRSADMTLGGQGAPLAPFYHFALAKYLRLTGPVVFLNIGGVANITWLDADAASPEAPGACLSFDTGPGNALIDDLCAARLGERMDRDGVLTRAGEVDMEALQSMLIGRAFFAEMPPKSLDRQDFTDWMDLIQGLPDADAVATLASGTAGAISMAMDHCPAPPRQVLVSGGGRRNPGLMEMIAGLLDCPVRPVEELGLDGDMLEAQAFAYLAVRVQRGLPTSAPGTTGVAAPVGGGVLSEG